MKDKTQPTTSSLSTMWAIKNCPSLDDFFEASQRLGFQKIELNHQINSTMLSHVRLDHIQFSSIHEPCPADISTKDLAIRDWLISSDDEPSRMRGVEAVRNSINLAHELNAPVVVMHCGNVTPSMDFERKLRGLFDQGKFRSEEYERIKSQTIHARAESAPPRINAVKKSITDLLGYAEQLKIKLGLENRYHYM